MFISVPALIVSLEFSLNAHCLEKRQINQDTMEYYTAGKKTEVGLQNMLLAEKMQVTESYGQQQQKNFEMHKNNILFVVLHISKI